MKRKSILWQAAGFAFATFAGTVLHFLYEWTGESILVAPFSGVNESTWEHMKLLYWPLFIFAMIQCFFYENKQNYWSIKFAEILIGILLIPVFFYTYNGVFGKSPDWINIAIFYLSALLVYLFEWWAFQKASAQSKCQFLAFAGICTIGILFVAFTFMPPKIPLFQDPLANIR